MALLNGGMLGQIKGILIKSGLLLGGTFDFQKILVHLGRQFQQMLLVGEIH